MFPFQSGVQPLSAFARASTLRGCFAESRKLKVACRVPGADSSKSVVHDDGRRKGPGPEALEAGVFALRSLEDWSADSRVRAFLAPDQVCPDKAFRAPDSPFLESAL